MMHRFFTDKQNVIDGRIAIYGEDVKHISKVLRLSIGDIVCICDGDCMEYISKISSIESDCVYLTIEDKQNSQTESLCKVDLYQGLPKAGRLETIIQKCVELGVNRIVPFQAERSVAKAEPKDFTRKLERYNRVAYEAAKQSKRGRIPKLAHMHTLSDIGFSMYDKLIVAYEDEKDMTLKRAMIDIPSDASIAVFIGPEGGFTPGEIDFLRRRGAVAVSLGARILRTETAGMAMLAMIMYEMESRV